MKNKILVAAYMLICVALTSCFEEYDKSYKGPLQVEFDPSPNINKSVTVPAGGTVKDSLKVQLIGPQQPEAIEGSYTVVSDKTTAVEGTDYTLMNSGRYTIPAGSSFGYVVFSLNKPSASKTLTLQLQTTDKVIAAEYYKTSTVTIR